MADKIRILPDVVANQIAAGEVVNNPSSVVKELMENAVDAGAGSVSVNFRDAGKELIQVVDDGCGMSPIDARLAFDRHATSKIRAAEDIYSLHSLGFRGEALASIAAVAEVEVRTRQQGDQVGTSVEIGGGTFRSQQSINTPEGTQFRIQNLFYNLPARRRFIESTPKESRRIKEEFRRVALCHPDVAFTLYENDAPIYNLPAAPLRSRIVGVIGKHIAANLLEVSAHTSLVQIEGFVGRPASSKQNNTEHYLFVNGRYFKSPYFQRAIFDAFHKLIPAHTKPSYFLYLTLDPERIDVNVHPQKTEVKFQDGQALWQIINAAVRESLGKLGALPMMDFDADTSLEIPVQRQGVSYRMPAMAPNPDFNPFVRDTSIDYHSSIAPEATMEGWDESVIEFIEGDTSTQGVLEVESGAMFSTPLPISGRYCAAVLGGELVVVDVRRAWEAVLFDRYMRLAGASMSASQGLLFPEQIALSMEECALAREHRDALSGLGFEFAVVDEQTLLLSAVPADFAGGDVAELLHELLDVLSDQVGSAEELRRRTLCQTMARSGAAGVQTHNETSLEELLRQLPGCAQPNLTPSGLPTMLRISQKEIQTRL